MSILIIILILQPIQTHEGQLEWSEKENYFYNDTIHDLMFWDNTT